jgi:transposase InsO family protein
VLVWHEYRSRSLSITALRRIWLAGLITEIHGRNRGTYESRRVSAELTTGTGVSVSGITIEKLMRIAGVRGIPKCNGVRNIKNEVSVGDLVKPDFGRAGPNQFWVTDITEHPTREGKLYCAAAIPGHGW